MLGGSWVVEWQGSVVVLTKQVVGGNFCIGFLRNSCLATEILPKKRRFQFAPTVQTLFWQIGKRCGMACCAVQLCVHCVWTFGNLQHVEKSVPFALPHVGNCAVRCGNCCAVQCKQGFADCKRLVGGCCNLFVLVLAEKSKRCGKR